MEKHMTLVGILNIVYRGFALVGAVFLMLLSTGFGYVVDFLVHSRSIGPDEIPLEMMNIIPLILMFAAVVMIVVSAAGIIGAIGVLKRKEWARILLLVVSFFNLLHIPLGTVLGAYTIWVLLNDRTIREFDSGTRKRQAR